MAGADEKSGWRSARAPAAFRAGDWWDYKLTPPLAMLWATTIQAGRPLLPTWSQAPVLIAAIAACAAYVCLINDHYDRDEDRRSGKPNRLSNLSPAAAGLLIALACGAGLLFLSLWRSAPAAAAAYLGSWIAFTLYSAPPARLKTRGLPGLLADATGASLLPCLLAVFLAAHAIGRAPDPSWLAAVAAWAFGWGLRGIIWHQLADLESDRLGGVRTFAQRHGRESAARIWRLVALPLELAGLAALLWQLGSALPPLFLLLYLGLVAARFLLWGAARHQPLWLDEYYDSLLPVALVLAAGARNPADLWLLAPLLLAFGRRPAIMVADCWRLGRTLIAGLRKARLARGPGEPTPYFGAAAALWRARASSAKPVVSASDAQ